MARTTDRQHVSEAARLSKRWNMYHYLGGVNMLDDRGNELNIEYSKAGRMTSLIHWQPVEGTRCARREPIYKDKRAYALAVIRGEK